ncbi:apurinic endonuclease (APN1) [Edhazardia aedis USNM 41457]|uniref:Apurinic-apyrimidinic endonuclease 1 n=1 Tax=Edhazardia aedis (strain USNM 41457) TaxID=1003232 RepID=J8ZQZ5_EDHAE|nr:apurinic endonuclease (APN1) [Edhazardia aedis USNM 41457]|eukprot:EJW02098.1 apurinic endonuclease (APN1) [Edhazardia aedis USNM 41457]
MVKLLGAHLSTSNGLHTLQEKMEKLSIKTCAFFVRNPRGFSSKALTDAELLKWKSSIQNPEILLPHAPYIINLANKEQCSKHLEVLEHDLEKLSILGVEYYNLHPGSDVSKLGKDGALKLIISNLNKLKNKKVTVVIENMAGDGKKVGGKFEDLRYIVNNVQNKEKIGVCLDTCHMFAAGYDIRKPEKFEAVMKDFDRIVGLKYLKGVHLNDSKHNIASNKDRHEEIGKGCIGIECFKYIMNSDYFNDIPMILETPEPDNYLNEIKLLRSLEIKENNDENVDEARKNAADDVDENRKCDY